MKAIDIAKIFQKLQRSSAKGQNPEEEENPEGKVTPKSLKG
jgi:hypothetical protein